MSCPKQVTQATCPCIDYLARVVETATAMLLSPIGSPRKTLASLSFPFSTTIELRLPIELIEYIGELAIRSSKKCALSLCLVSTWMRRATLPHLYSTVILHDSIPSPLLSSPFHLSFCSGARLLPSPIEHIRHLWVDVGRDVWPYTFGGCTQLVQLAMHLECHESISHNDYGGTDNSDIPPCRSFTVLGQSHPIRWAPFTQSPQGLSFLRNLTHLRLLNMCLSHYIPLEHTPNLTHLCIPFFDLRSNEGSEFSGLDGILQYQNLKLIVLTLNPRYWRFEAMTLKQWAMMALEKDDRLHVVASIRVDATRDWEDAKRDWESEARSGQSIWDKAIQVRHKFMSRNQDS